MRHYLSKALKISSAFFAIGLLLNSYANAQESEKAAKKPAYVIESVVQGSQEQPNVIYITPWQEDTKAVVIQEQSLQVSLPKLTPVQAKAFKQKLSRYYAKP